MEELPGDIKHIIKDAGHVAVKWKWKSGLWAIAPGGRCAHFVIKRLAIRERLQG